MRGMSQSGWGTGAHGNFPITVEHVSLDWWYEPGCPRVPIHVGGH